MEVILINIIADYRSINPASIGTITIARPGTSGNGYSLPTQPTLVLSAECAGIKLETRGQGSDRTPVGTVDRTIWRCVVADTVEARAIESGMWARIEWRETVIEGKVDVREPKQYEARRFYIDTSENCPIDWSIFATGEPIGSLPELPQTPPDMISESIIVPFFHTDDYPKVVYNNTVLKTLFVAKVVVQVPFNDLTTQMMLGDFAQYDRLMSSQGANPTVDPGVVGEYQTTPAWRPSQPNEIQIVLNISPGTSTQGQGYVRLELSNY